MTNKSKNDNDKFAPWRDFKIVIGFFTRLPISFDEKDSKDAFVKSVWAFPFAGLVIGIIGAITFSVAINIGLSLWLSAFLTIGATALVTGALHEDGLSDFFDGLWGGVTPEGRLEIMRDSTIGTYGALTLIIATGLKVSALASQNADFVCTSLIAAHSLSRGILPVIMSHMQPAGKLGLAASIGKPDKALSFIALAIGIALTLGLLGLAAGLGSIILVGLSVFAMMRLAQHKLGGYNGDMLGAAQQISEVSVFICCAAYFG